AEGVGAGAAETAHAGVAGDAGMAEAVVGSALVGLREDLVSLFDFLELRFGVGVARVAVRVIFHGQAPVRLFEIGLSCVSADTQDFVVIAFRHSDLSLATPAAHARALPHRLPQRKHPRWRSAPPRDTRAERSHSSAR